MKRIYNLMLVGAATLALASCSDDDPKMGNPVMDVKTDLSSACFGDSLTFTINASDSEVALSTIHATLYYDGEEVSETVIRTKVSGQDYVGKIYVPYYANVPDGRAQLKLTLQNINFTITEKEYEIPITHPDYASLTFIDEDGNEYTMARQEQYVYAFTDKLPQKLKGFIRAPKYGENGNELTWGYSSNQITIGAESGIPFSNSKAGKYTVSFNTFTFEGSPFVVLMINDQELEMTSDTESQIDLTLSKNQSVIPSGFPNYADWWIDPDYFEKQDDGSLKFLAESGNYRIIADQGLQYFRVYSISGGAAATLADDGSGALWVIGENVGKPSVSANAVGWTTENALCMAPIGNNCYQLTVVGGKTVSTDKINFKFFGQMGWGVELKGSTSLTSTSDIVLVGDGNGHDDGNLYLADGASLKDNVIYRFVVDCSAGIDAAVLSVYEEGEQPFEEKVITLNGTKMSTADNMNYSLAINLNQGDALEFSASDIDDYYLDCDYFAQDEDGNITFLPVSGNYKVTLNATNKSVGAARLSDSGSEATFSDGHAIYMVGQGIGFPSVSNEVGWDSSRGYAVAEVSPNVYQFSGYAGAEGSGDAGDKIRYDYISFKYYQNRSWGHEYNLKDNITLASGTENYIAASGNGDILWASTSDIQEGDFVVITFDLSAGEDNAVLTVTKK
ncbi:MAG: DUF5125 domain-containing protein [Bacteroidales bacterium]|nr:DUF5125 domain-containing protein [Bacteroidales bacterium]